MWKIECKLLSPKPYFELATNPQVGLLANLERAPYVPPEPYKGFYSLEPSWNPNSGPIKTIVLF